MSKTKRRVILTALIAVCLLAELAACSNNDKAAETKAGTQDLEGKYVIVDVIDDPDGATFDDLDGMYKDADLDFADFAYIEFFDGGAYEFVLFGEPEAKGYYSLDGKTLTLTDGSNTISAEISGAKMSLDYGNGATLVFEKK